MGFRHPGIEKGAQQLVMLSADILLTSVPPGSVTIGDTDFILPPATETRQGVIELATGAEVAAGTDAARAITPAALLSRTATDARTGLVELATDAEALAGEDTTRAVTPSALKTALLAAFPVGAVYITAGNTNPSTFLGGTWSQIAQGRTLMGVGMLGADTYAAGATGGAARVTLTTTEIPAHNHGGDTGTNSADHTHSGTTASAGAHTHSQPDTWRSTGVDDTGGPNPVGADAAGAISSSPLKAMGSAGAHIHTFTTGTNSASHTHAINSQGGGGAHENRPPYLAVYFWKRTA
jgi:microcystin-dependent protein